MLDQILVRIGCIILCDVLEAIEQIVRVDFDEAIDVDNSNIGLVAVVPVADVAMILDLLTARAIVPPLANLVSDQIPFLPSSMKVG